MPPGKNEGGAWLALGVTAMPINVVHMHTHAACASKGGKAQSHSQHRTALVLTSCNEQTPCTIFIVMHNSHHRRRIHMH